MYTDDDLLPLSAVQHLLFCKRQCALIHVEQSWVENYFTAAGRVMHEKAHSEKAEWRGNVRIERGLPLKSLTLGLIGKADVVEFHHTSEGDAQVFPVEYKRGKSKPNDCDRVQLCAQAICLEEALFCTIPEGAIFYGQNKQREYVLFDDGLRSKTQTISDELHALIESGITPQAEYSKKCDACSLQELCMPESLDKKTVTHYMEKMVKEDEKTF